MDEVVEDIEEQAKVVDPVDVNIVGEDNDEEEAEDNEVDTEAGDDKPNKESYQIKKWKD